MNKRIHQATTSVRIKLCQLLIATAYAVAPKAGAERLRDFQEMLDDHNPRSWAVKGWATETGFTILGKQLSAPGDYSYQFTSWDCTHEADADEFRDKRDSLKAA